MANSFFNTDHIRLAALVRVQGMVVASLDCGRVRGRFCAAESLLFGEYWVSLPSGITR